jgi:hypothetical protein
MNRANEDPRDHSLPRRARDHRRVWTHRLLRRHRPVAMAALLPILISGAPSAGQAQITGSVYVDSRNGDDTNDGTGPSTAKRTLTAAAGLLGPGSVLHLVRGSHWRETLVVSANRARVQAFGEGDPPVIDGADVVSGWTPVPGASRVWQTEVTHEGYGTHRLTVYEDGELLTRVPDRNTCEQTAGSFVDIKGGDGSPLVVQIHPRGGDNPDSNGRTYEVSRRLYALRIDAHGVTVSGVETLRQIHNDGSLAAVPLTGVEVDKTLMADGTKHNAVIGSGTIRDSIAYGSDEVTALEPSNIAFTFHMPDPSGESVTVERVGTIGIEGGDFLAHNSGSGAYASITLRQIWGIDTRFPSLPDPSFGTTLDGAFYRGGVSLPVNVPITRMLAILPPASGASNLYGSTRYTDCAIFAEDRYSVANYDEILRANSDGTIVLDHLAIAGPRTYSTVFGLAGMTNGSLASHGCVFFGGQAHLKIASGATYAGDHNVFHTTHPDTAFELFCERSGTAHTTLSGWQAATGQDASSVWLKDEDQTGANAFWLGISSGLNNGPVDGDWRINPHARVYNAAGAALTGTFADGTPITRAGPQTHWDWNARTAKPGPARSWPRVPETRADSRAYIRDPAGWNFYPERVSSPVFSPDPGTHADTIEVSLSCETNGASIHFTTDGSEPTAASPLYAGPLLLENPATIKAIAVKAGTPDSSVREGAYRFATTFGEWLGVFFTPSQLADPAISGSSADPDHDTTSNLLEFAFNLDPTRSDSRILTSGTGRRGLPVFTVETVGSERRMMLEFVRRIGSSGPGTGYHPEFAPAPSSTSAWQEDGTEEVEPIDARWERVRVLKSTTDGKGFARVRVE